MKTRKIVDWKDIANSYHEKATCLAILILLFAFLVSPKIEVKPFKRVIRITETIEIPPEIKEKIKPPETTIKPIVQIIVEEDFEGDEDEDIEIVDTIEKTTLDPYIEKVLPKFGTTPKFVVYEDPPVPIKQIRPIYTDFARRSGIEGEVWLEVEVLADGSVGAIEVKKSLLSGPGGLDEAAIKAVRQWEYSPAKSGGKPVACWVTFPVSFSLD